jgi:hypothetical protein
MLRSGGEFAAGFVLPQFLNRFRLRVAVVTALALLFAQFGAMTHAYSHDTAVEHSSSHSSTPGTHDFCGDCLNFAPLLSAAGAPSALPCSVPQARTPSLASVCASLVDHRPTLAFRSRAPPATH